MVGSGPERKKKKTNVKQHMMLDGWRFAASVMQIAQNQSNVTQVSSRQTCHVSVMTNQIAEMDLASMLLTSILPPRGVFGFFSVCVLGSLETDQEPKNGTKLEGQRHIFKAELG